LFSGGQPFAAELCRVYLIIDLDDRKSWMVQNSGVYEQIGNVWSA